MEGRELAPAARRLRLRVADNLRLRRLADLVPAELQSLDVREVGALGERRGVRDGVREDEVAALPAGEFPRVERRLRAKEVQEHLALAHAGVLLRGDLPRYLALVRYELDRDVGRELLGAMPLRRGSAGDERQSTDPRQSHERQRVLGPHGLPLL